MESYYTSSNRRPHRPTGYSVSGQQSRGDQPRYYNAAPDTYSPPLIPQQGGYYNVTYPQQVPVYTYDNSPPVARLPSSYHPSSESQPMMSQSSYSQRLSDSPPPYGTTTEAINANAPYGHKIRELPVSAEDMRRYMERPSKQDCENGWRPGHFKCLYQGCTTNAVEEHRVQMHLSLHINSKKAYACDCGTRFGRLSEANRHLEDQNPCQVCGDPRRKQRGTTTCNRCFTNSR